MEDLLRILCLGLLAATASAVPAIAESPEMPQVYDWSGFYVGGHAGYGFGDEDWTLLDNPGEGESGSIGEVVTEHDIDGILAGVQFGRNWQRGNLVFGAEIDFSIADINGSSARIAGGEKPGPREWATDMNWLATLGPRAGYATGRTLFFVEGGLAIADEDYYHLGAKAGQPPGQGPEREYRGSDTRGGLFLGVGIEHAFADAWSGRVEYNYIGFGADSASLFGSPASPAVFDIDQAIHVVKFSINYHFKR